MKGSVLSEVISKVNFEWKIISHGKEFYSRSSTMQIFVLAFFSVSEHPAFLYTPTFSSVPQWVLNKYLINTNI